MVGGCGQGSADSALVDMGIAALRFPSGAYGIGEWVGVVKGSADSALATLLRG